MRPLFYLYYSIHNMDIVILITTETEREVKDSAKKSGLAQFSSQDGSARPSSLIQHHLHEEGCVNSDRGGGTETAQKLTCPSHFSGPAGSLCSSCHRSYTQGSANSRQWRMRETYKSQSAIASELSHEILGQCIVFHLASCGGPHGEHQEALRDSRAIRGQWHGTYHTSGRRVTQGKT